jgi:hypothetical protein
MKQSPSSEANSHSGCKEIHLLWNLYLIPMFATAFHWCVTFFNHEEIGGYKETKFLLKTAL